MGKDNNEFIPFLKFNKLLLNRNFESKFKKYIEDKIDIRNVFTFYNVINMFNLPTFSKTTFTYIERCFTIVVESPNFIELNFILVKKVLASCHLKLTSEVEVFNE